MSYESANLRILPSSVNALLERQSYDNPSNNLSVSRDYLRNTFFSRQFYPSSHPDELPFLFRHQILPRMEIPITEGLRAWGSFDNYTSGGAHAYYLFGFRFRLLLLPRLLLSGFYLRFCLLAPAEADGGE